MEVPGTHSTLFLWLPSFPLPYPSLLLSGRATLCFRHFLSACSPPAALLSPGLTSLSCCAAALSLSLSPCTHTLSHGCAPPLFGSIFTSCDCQLTLLVCVWGSWVMVHALFFLFNYPLHPLPLQARGFSLMSSHCQHTLWAMRLLDTPLQPPPLQPFQGMQVTCSNLRVSHSSTVLPHS